MFPEQLQFCYFDEMFVVRLGQEKQDGFTYFHDEFLKTIWDHFCRNSFRLQIGNYCKKLFTSKSAIICAMYVFADVSHSL
jgi:hypothetical protein